MGTEAQKLITVSLEKIANFRRRRREMSLHKNLLVTTVIHKARIAIMEETYYMYAAESNRTDSSPYVAATDVYSPPPPTYGCPQGGQLVLLPEPDDTNMEWEGMNNGDNPVATRCDDDDDEEDGDEDDDKENLTPTTTVIVRGHKRHRTGTNDDESSQPKKIKWDIPEQPRCCYGDDEQLIAEEDDTSHALRLVSVLMSGATATSSGCCSTAAALRLVRSFSTTSSSTELCSQQANKVAGPKEMRTMMTMGGSCANRTPLAIAV